ncbi:hypothetical protein BHE74_00057881 [Ensete ventricosum]|nr:hypothetical protein BHE74_00057881 [Ensete ventricosum]RZS19572.1 hypothetical protein BHM03_00051982 [Ensete ventricosum]
MSKVAVSFTHIIKSGEPAFSVLVSRFVLGERFPVPVYLSLVPIIGGCALAALTELNFDMTGSYLPVETLNESLSGNIYDALSYGRILKQLLLSLACDGLQVTSVSGMNYYACLSMLSLLILLPFAIGVEGPQLWAAGWHEAISQIGPHFVW